MSEELLCPLCGTNYNPEHGCFCVRPPVEEEAEGAVHARREPGL